MIPDFEQRIHDDLHQYLLAKGEVDECLPEAPDLEERWEAVGQSYMADGVREFNGYPTVSLGWMMYVGMALAQLWDSRWEEAASLPDLYLHLRDSRGYDAMDEYIREEVLGLGGDDYAALEHLVGDCAGRVYNALRHGGFEAGTKDAFMAYVACLHQLYLFGVAIQLKRLGYKMTLVQ